MKTSLNRMGRIRLFPLLFQNGCSQSSRFLPQARRIVGSGDEKEGNEDCNLNVSFAHAHVSTRKIICPTCLEASHYTQGCHASTLADHVISTGHNIKWDNFDIFATGKSDLQCKIKGTLLISELKPSLNENVVVARSYFFLLISFGSINFVIVFYLVTSSSLYFCFF